ncbi:MAG: hypothetical protein EAX96_13575 [Candidatus Lokiarchaeota archaeon]|nr:hypothetical protein [Candidatus Lokiarchaeota archaeon]
MNIEVEFSQDNNNFWIEMRDKLIKLGIPKNFLKQKQEKRILDLEKWKNRLDSFKKKMRTAKENFFNKIEELNDILKNNYRETMINLQEIYRELKGYDLTSLNQLYFIDMFDLDIKTDNINLNSVKESANSITNAIYKIVMDKNNENERRDALEEIEDSELNIFSRISTTLKENSDILVKKLKSVGKSLPDVKLKKIKIEAGLTIFFVSAKATFEFEIYD